MSIFRKSTITLSRNGVNDTFGYIALQKYISRAAMVRRRDPDHDRQSLRCRPRRKVRVNVVLLQSIVIKVVPLRITLHMRQCDAGRLSHDIAELTGDLQLSLPRIFAASIKEQPHRPRSKQAHRHLEPATCEGGRRASVVDRGTFRGRHGSPRV